MKHIFRKELYTHQEVCGGMWAIDAFVNEGISCVLTAASDGTVRGGYTSLMTCFKPKNSSTMQLGRMRTAYSSADGSTCTVQMDSQAQVLAAAIGTETFPQAGEVSVHAIHSAPLGRPSVLSLETETAAPSAPATVRKTPKKVTMAGTAASTMVALDSDSEAGEQEGPPIAAIFRKAAKNAAASALKKRSATQKSKSDDDDEDSASEGSDALEELQDSDDPSSDSEADAPAVTKGRGKAKEKSVGNESQASSTVTPAKAAKAKAPKSASKSTTKSAAKKTPVKDPATPVAPASFDFHYTEEATQPAELRLVAYGGQSGLLRILSFDPLRTLIAPSLNAQVKGKK